MTPADGLKQTTATGVVPLMSLDTRKPGSPMAGPSEMASASRKGKPRHKKAREVLDPQHMSRTLGEKIPTWIVRRFSKPFATAGESGSPLLKKDLMLSMKFGAPLVRRAPTMC